MTNQSTIDKLIEMHMTSMADAFRNQMQDISMKEIPFDDRFGMIVDIEYTSRKNSRLKRLIKNAEFEQPDATIAAVDYGHNRKVNRHLIERLATCEYITEYRNIFITGATGSGKTYLACAFGMEACKRYYSVKYVRVPDLLLASFMIERWFRSFKYEEAYFTQYTPTSGKHGRLSKVMYIPTTLSAVIQQSTIRHPHYIIIRHC